MQIGAPTATCLHVQALIDGFVAHLHQLVIAMIAGQHLGDESGAPPVIHPRFNRRAQPMIAELERFGPRGLLRCTRVSQSGVIVPIGQAISLNLAPDHRAVASDPPRNLSTRQAGITAPHDLKTLTEAEPMTHPARRAQITRMSQPASPGTAH